MLSWNSQQGRLIKKYGLRMNYEAWVKRGSTVVLSGRTLLGNATGISRYALLVLFVSGLMSNDSGAIELTIAPSLSFASFASIRRTGSISCTPGPHQLSEWCSEKQKVCKQENNRVKIHRAILWNQKNFGPIAKHPAWKDYMLFQKQTQVHEGENNFLQQGTPLRRARLRDILLGTVLQFRSQWDKLGSGI